MTDIDRAYRERNTIACALARSFLNAGGRAGVALDPQGEDGFRVVVVVMLPAGRVGWHMDERDPARPWADLPELPEPWESFTSEVNAARLQEFLRGGPADAETTGAKFKANLLRAHDKTRAMIACIPDADFDFVADRIVQVGRIPLNSVFEAAQKITNITAGDLAAGLLASMLHADPASQRKAHVVWRRGQMGLVSEGDAEPVAELSAASDPEPPALSVVGSEEAFDIRFEQGTEGECAVVAMIDAEPSDYKKQGLYWLGWSLDMFSGARLLVDLMFRGGLKAIRLTAQGFEIEWQALKPKPHPMLPEFPNLQVREPDSATAQFTLFVTSAEAPTKGLRVPIGRHAFVELATSMMIRLGYNGVAITSSTDLGTTHAHTVAWER